MRRDGLRIDPKARPYGMQAFDLLAELVEGMRLEVSAPLPAHGARLLRALGVQLDLAIKREGGRSCVGG